MQPFHRLKNFVKVLFYALACYVSAGHPMGRCRHYVFELTVHLYVRACVRACVPCIAETFSDRLAVDF